MAYKKYESENVILPYSKFPSYQQIEKIQPIQKIQPYTSYRGWDDERRAIYNARKNKQVETFLSNYNDPTELNSYIDALTNREAVSKKFGDAWGTISTVSGTVSVLSWIGAAIAAIIPGGQPVAAALATTAKLTALPAIPAAIDVTVEKGIKPVLAGKPKEAGLNMLMNLGETMDYAANPIKGLFLEGGEGFIKGTGLAEGGRVNYDYDTGFFLTDMLLETISDPINMLQIGAKTIIKSSADSIAKPLGKQLANTTQETFSRLDKTIYGEFTQEAYEKVEKQMTKAYANAVKTLNDATSQNLSKKAKKLVINTTKENLQKQYKRALKTALPNLTNEQIDIIMKQGGRSVATGQFTKSTLSHINNLQFDTLASDTIKNLSRGLAYTDEFEKFMTKHAFMTSGYGAGVALAKKGFKPISQYVENSIIQKLKKPNLIDTKIGIDLKHFEEAKNTWINSNKYMQEITGEISTLDESAFFNYVTQQFSRDRQLIDQLIDQHRLHPIKQAAALDSIINSLYSKFGIKNFEEYISVIKGIDEANNGRFIKFVNHVENVFKTTNEKSLAKSMGAKFQKGVQLLSGNNPESYLKNQAKALENLVQITNANKELDFGKNIYILKYNDEAINAVLVNNPVVVQAFEEILGSDKMGAFLTNIIEDINALAPEMRAALSDTVRALKQAGSAFKAIRSLYNNVGELVLDEVSGINIKQLRRYIIDEIFGLANSNVSDLLANFDNVTINKIMEGLSIMLQDLGFNEANYPTMRLQIAQVLKQYLEDLDGAGIEYVKTGIAQDFTSSVATLNELFGDKYADEFIQLNMAAHWIQDTLKQVKQGNIDLSNIMGNTILDVFNVRQLADYGLAVRVVNLQDALNYFILDGLDGIKLQQAERIGKALKHLKERFEQYNFIFNDAKAEQIAEVYDKFYKTYIQNSNSSLNIEAFRYLLRTEDPIEQFAQLVEFNKTLYNDKLAHREFMQLFGTHDKSSWELLQDIRDPSRLLNTDFAWDAMSQTAWLAQREFNETLINGMIAYKNLGLKSGKLTNDFRAMRELLTQNKLDRPKALMLERYIKAAAPTQKYLMNLKEYYNALFDRELATRKIEGLRDACSRFPEFDEKYSDLITELDEYWKGLKTFKQDPKYMRDKPNYVDEFTPFWERIKTMNDDYAKIQRKGFKEEDLADILSPEDLEFLNAPEQAVMKNSIINTIIDPDYTMSNEDVDYYLEFIRRAFVKNASIENIKEGMLKIPYDYIPASFKRLDFKFYHDILGIEDINLVYNIMGDPYLGGWHTHSKYDINAVVNTLYDFSQRAAIKYDKPFNKTAYDTLKQIRWTYVHESGHAVLEKVFSKKNDKIYNYLEQFKTRFIERFGIDYYNDRLNYIAQVYHRTPGYGDYPIDIAFEKAYETGAVDKISYMQILEELFTFTLAREIDPLELTTDLAQFADELMEELQMLMAPNLDKLVKETFEEYNLRRLKTHYNRTIETITPWDPFKKQQEFNKLINKTTDAQAKGSLYNLLKRSPQAFAEELAFRKGFIVFEDSDISDLINPKQFKYINEQFEKNNIHHIYDKTTQRHWYVLDKNAYTIDVQGSQVCLNGNPLIRDFKNTYNEYSLVDKHTKNFKYSLVKQLQDWDETMYTLTGSRIGSSQGEVITQDSFNKLFIKDKNGVGLVPDEVMEHLPKDKYGNVYFDKSFFENYVFNETFLGTGNTKRKFGIYSSNMIINMDNATAQAEQLLKPKVEYVNTVFDSQLSISSKNSIWENFSDQDLLEALQDAPEYKLIVLVEDPKYGSKVREILPTSIDNIKKARELGAVIVPLQTFKDMYNVCNHRLGAAGFSKLWSRIMYIYKFGHLLKPGAWFRNFIDTNLKSKLEMGNMYNSYQAQAHKILNDVDNLKNYIRKVTKDAAEVGEDIGSIQQLTKRWFDENNAKYLTFDQYKELQADFLSQGIAGNVMADLYAGNGGTAWQQFTRISGNIIDSVNTAENYNRLAMYLYELDKGADYTSALAKLAKTHFDYSFKTKVEQLIDMVFPFTTFSLRNLSYWVEALEKQPWLMRNYIHLMKPHWDFKDYTPEELARDYRVQNQILNGQLKLGEFNNKLITFKANPSIQDALQMFSDPINNVYEKLAAPISYPIDIARGEYTDVLNTIPVVGPMIQDIKSTIKTGTPLPSAISVAPIPRRTGIVKFKNNNLKDINNFTDNTYRTPKYRNNIVYDTYATKGIKRYKLNMYPVIDIAHEIRSRYTVNVANRIKNRVEVNVYKGIRYRMRLDTNRFR